VEIWTTARLDPAFFAIQLIEPLSGVKWINGNARQAHDAIVIEVQVDCAGREGKHHGSLAPEAIL
jgi:hypothetical protein